jgi:hypothetical protein
MKLLIRGIFDHYKDQGKLNNVFHYLLLKKDAKYCGFELGSYILVRIRFHYRYIGDYKQTCLYH